MSGLDRMPPSRIIDFKLLKTFSENEEYLAELSWTASGGDRNVGEAARYEIRCFSGRSIQQRAHLDENGLSISKEKIPLPEKSGTQQRANVTVPWPNEVFYYAIMAVDEVFVN